MDACGLLVTWGGRGGGQDGLPARTRRMLAYHAAETPYMPDRAVSRVVFVGYPGPGRLFIRFSGWRSIVVSQSRASSSIAAVSVLQRGFEVVSAGYERRDVGDLVGMLSPGCSAATGSTW